MPAAARAWQAAALELTATGVVDTVFADGCTAREEAPPGAPPLPPARVQQLLEAKYATLRSLQSHPAVRGPIVCGSDGEFVPGVGAVQAEGWGVAGRGGRTHFASIEIPMLMKAARHSVLFQAHGRAVCGQSGQLPPCCRQPPCNCTAPVRPRHGDPAVQTELAAFLVGMGRYSYFVCGAWEDTFSSSPASSGGAGGSGPATSTTTTTTSSSSSSSSSTWMDVYDFPLGEPLGNATLDAHGVWHRSFASGTNASFDTKAEVGRVDWAGHASMATASAATNAAAW